MGYSTDFQGRFVLDKQLTPEHAEYLRKFSGTRRMKRDVRKAVTIPDPVRFAAKLEIGVEAGYFVGGSGSWGQDHDDSVIDPTNPPQGQPQLWCQWTVSDDNQGIEWDGGEKFYSYIQWLRYIVQHFLDPWGYILNGEVKWEGEESSDTGVIICDNNIVSTRKT